MFLLPLFYWRRCSSQIVMQKKKLSKCSLDFMKRLPALDLFHMCLRSDPHFESEKAAICHFLCPIDWDIIKVFVAMISVIVFPMAPISKSIVRAPFDFEKYENVRYHL